MEALPGALADQALENLVNQFARPMDFLRELVQNSIDAGSPRVDVRVELAPQAGDPATDDVFVEIHVDDSGEGMDEEIIDAQLTRMFSSSKEGDLTKIGKFGVGFTSIFAIEPEAVLLHTGRHGQSWELLFHPDRSFDKVRLDQPVRGTQITLFKRMRRDRVPAFVQECRWVLTTWCEHSDTPVTFWDHTQATPTRPIADSDDPFAAFSEPLPGAGPETVSHPLTLDADLALRHSRDGVQIVVGYGDDPLFAFYNGGLTLLHTRSPDVLGEHQHSLGHLRFKIKYDRLEHTLTRDNVLLDENWLRAMQVLHEAAAQLRARLLDRVAQAASEGTPLAPWHRHLHAEALANRLHIEAPDFAQKVHLRDWRSAAVPYAQVRRAERATRAILVDDGDHLLCAALAERGHTILADEPDALSLLRATAPPALLGLWTRERRIERAGDLFALPRLLDLVDLPGAERRLMRTAIHLAEAATRGRVLLRLGDFSGAETGRPLGTTGPQGGGVFERRDRAHQPTSRRCVIIDRHHPVYRAQVIVAAENPDVAALALVQAALTEEGVETEDTYRTLVDRVAHQLLLEAP